MAAKDSTNLFLSLGISISSLKLDSNVTKLTFTLSFWGIYKEKPWITAGWVNNILGKIYSKLSLLSFQNYKDKDIHKVSFSSW